MDRDGIVMGSLATPGTFDLAQCVNCLSGSGEPKHPGLHLEGSGVGDPPAEIWLLNHGLEVVFSIAKRRSSTV